METTNISMNKENVKRKKERKNTCYVHTMKYYSVFKKKELLPSVTPWVDLEDIMLSEMS